MQSSHSLIQHTHTFLVGVSERASAESISPHIEPRSPCSQLSCAPRTVKLTLAMWDHRREVGLM